MQSKLSAAESQVVLTKKDSQRDTANAASVADLEKTVSVLQESVKVLNSQLSASKEAEGSAKKNLQEEIKRREIDIVEGKKAISAERDTLLKEHTSLKLQHAAQSKEIADKEEANRNLLKQFDELKQNLLESETRLMEAEEAAWKTKAEAAEILYALELEQSSVKKLNDELDIIRKDAPQVAVEHTLHMNNWQMYRMSSQCSFLPYSSSRFTAVYLL